MDEDNQSSSSADDKAVDGADNSQTDVADNSTDTSDEQTSKDAAADGQQTEDKSEDKSDVDELAAFAESQGFSKDDLENETARRAIELARKQRSEEDKRYAKERELAEKVSSFGDKVPSDTDEAEYEDPLEAKLAAVERAQNEQARKIATGMFFAQNPEANEYVDAMDTIAQEKPYLYNDLPVLFELAKARGIDTESLKEAAKKEAREEIAKAGQASAPSASASDSTPPTGKKFSRSQISEMSREEYAKNREAIIAAEEAGTVIEDS